MSKSAIQVRTSERDNTHPDHKIIGVHTLAIFDCPTYKDNNDTDISALGFLGKRDQDDIFLFSLNSKQLMQVYKFIEGHLITQGFIAK